MTADPKPLSEDQTAALADIELWLRDPRPGVPYFVLHGLAGTGKTDLMARIARARPAMMCAFTGKAASVLRARTGLAVGTVHGAIYNYNGTLPDEDGVDRPVFTDKGADYAGRLVLLDECSTVGTRLAEDLLATGARVVACGDPGQLPPVRDRPFFDEPDATLREVHRQAWGSSIVRQAHAVRRGGNYAADGDDFRVVRKADLADRALLAFGGITLCWRNETRRRLNVSRRRALGRGGDVIEAGEPVMALRNDHALGVYNGAVYEVACRRLPGEDLQVVADNGRKVVLINATCEGLDPEFEARKNVEEWSPFTLAYATTVHKSQGSEWDDVLIIDEYNRSDQRENWLYTAVTRAAKRVVVVTT